MQLTAHREGSRHRQPTPDHEGGRRRSIHLPLTNPSYHLGEAGGSPQCASPCLTSSSCSIFGRRLRLTLGSRRLRSGLASKRAERSHRSRERWSLTMARRRLPPLAQEASSSGCCFSVQKDAWTIATAFSAVLLLWVASTSHSGLVSKIKTGWSTCPAVDALEAVARCGGYAMLAGALPHDGLREEACVIHPACSNSVVVGRAVAPSALFAF